MHTPTPTPTTTPSRPASRPELGDHDEAALHGRAVPVQGVHRTERSSAGRARALAVRVGLASALLAAAGLVGASAAMAASWEQGPPQGHTPGLADGWYAPDLDDGPPSTEAAGATGSIPTPIGYAAGRPDGWYQPGASDARVAGVSLTRATAATVPSNVR